MENNTDNESKKQVADSMIQSIFDSVNRLELHQRVMEEGVESIGEFLSIAASDWKQIIPQAQLKNMSLMITEFKITLAKTKPILAKDKYDKMNKTLNFCIQLHSQQSIERKGRTLELFTIGHDALNKKRWVVIGELFDYLVKLLSDLRIELLESLSNILYAFDKTKSNKQI